MNLYLLKPLCALLALVLAVLSLPDLFGPILKGSTLDWGVISLATSLLPIPGTVTERPQQ